jgi:hypothetical protein
VRVPHDQVAALAKLILQVHWDHATQPAIRLPLDRLFAAMDGPPTPASLALGAERDGSMVVLSLRLPMPFRSQTRWLVTNEGTQPVTLGIELRTVPGVPTQRWGYLTAQHFTTTLPLHGTHPLVRATGPGRLVGVCMAMRGHGMARRGHPFNFLEGDELGHVDGTRAIAGTGTEDYFNGAFYFEDGPGATPFAQVWNIQREVPGRPGQARANACRWHVLGDVVDFTESLELDMEVGPGDPSVLDRFESVAFLYLAPAGRATSP